MNSINDLLWNPEDEDIMPADEQMSDDCHGGSGCPWFADVALFSLEWC